MLCFFSINKPIKNMDMQEVSPIFHQLLFVEGFDCNSCHVEKFALHPLRLCPVYMASDYGDTTLFPILS